MTRRRDNGETLDAAHAGQDVRAAQEALRAMGQIFGLRLEAEGAEARVVAGWNEHLKRFVGTAEALEQPA